MGASLDMTLKAAGHINFGHENGQVQVIKPGEDFPGHLVSRETVEQLLRDGTIKYAHEFEPPQSVAEKLAASEEREKALAAEIEQLKQQLTAQMLRADLAERRGGEKSSPAEKAASKLSSKTGGNAEA